MDKLEYIKKLNKIEEIVISNLNLLEIAKNYCETNLEESDKFMALGTIINIMLDSQKMLLFNLDEQ
ncbi:hypothetical protein IJ750_06280 [bacterium]|nr:hypothetical protein [bacterium]